MVTYTKLLAPFSESWQNIGPGDLSSLKLKDIQKEIIKGLIRSTGIQGETFTYILTMLITDA